MESQLAPCNSPVFCKAIWYPHMQESQPKQVPWGVIAGPDQGCSCCAAQLPAPTAWEAAGAYSNAPAEAPPQIHPCFTSETCS